MIEGLMREQGLQQIQTRASAVANEQRVTGQDIDASIWQAQVAAHGSSTGFKALQGGLTDLAASSRPIKHQELLALASLGDLHTPQAEHVIGIDGVAVIVHPGNPLRQLDTQTLARIFSGEISDWQTIGGTPGRIVLYARDE
ncbi:substrate-binding domain-containing protein, partial [Pandoraea sputorum]|uniref:substrate-binding domain-containing protein n=1 Tax=Pandoraea sputorum TaxID=93222 RepID=UPI003558E5B8